MFFQSFLSSTLQVHLALCVFEFTQGPKSPPKIHNLGIVLFTCMRYFVEWPTDVSHEFLYATQTRTVTQSHMRKIYIYICEAPRARVT